MVLPFDQLADPDGSDAIDGGLDAGGDDPEVAADLAAAQAGRQPSRRAPRRPGATPRSPGFGIGRPTRAPTPRPGRNRPALAGRPTRPPGPSARSTSRRAAWSWPASPASACWSPPARRPSPPSGRMTGSSSACWVPACRSPAPWPWPGWSARGWAPDAVRRRRDLSSWSSSSSCSASSPSSPTTRSSPSSQRINKAWANIDVALKQRFDELPNLVSAVRGVMGFEQEVLTRVTELRNAYSGDGAGARAGVDLGGDQPGGPPAVRHGRELPEPEVGGQRARPAGRDRAARGRDRRSARALQRLGRPLQHPDPAAPGRPAGRACSAGSPATSSPSTMASEQSPRSTCRAAPRAEARRARPRDASPWSSPGSGPG